VIDFGRFIAGSKDGIEEVRKFAERASCFISYERARGMAGCWYVIVWAPEFCLPDHGDARSLRHLHLLPPMIDADLYD
jgi:hypothetical protein